MEKATIFEPAITVDTDGIRRIIGDVIEKYNEAEAHRGDGWHYVRCGFRDGKFACWEGWEANKTYSREEYYGRKGSDLTLVYSSQAYSPCAGDGIYEWHYIEEKDLDHERKNGEVYWGVPDTEKYLTDDEYTLNEEYTEYKPFVLRGFLESQAPSDGELDQYMQLIIEHYQIEDN